MANKRPPLSFPELEGRGRRAILRTSEEVQAEEALLAAQHAGNPAIQHDDEAVDARAAGHPASQGPGPADTPRSLPPSPPAPEPRPAAAAPPVPDASIPAFQHAGHPSYVKVTYRLSPTAVDAIEEAKRILRRQYHLKASLEEIAEEAILAAYRDLLENQHASNLARQLSSKPANKKASKPVSR